MQNSRALVIARDPARRQQLVECVERAGLATDGVCPDLLDDVVSHRLVFFAADATDPESMTRLTARLAPEVRCVLITPRATLTELVTLLEHPQLSHVFVGAAADNLADLEVTARKLHAGDIFGIEKYLPPDASISQLQIDDFEGRGRAIDAVLECAEQARMRRQVRTAIAQVCEELLMNALYDAPVDDDGVPLFAHVDPHDRIRAKSPRPVTIRFAPTATGFVIAVGDQYGLLAKNTLLSYLDKCLTSPDQIDRKTYGAGLGLYLVASTAGSMVVNVSPGIATEVLCAFDRGAKAPLRHISLFLHPDAGGVIPTGPTAQSANAKSSRASSELGIADEQANGPGGNHG